MARGDLFGGDRRHDRAAARNNNRNVVTTAPRTTRQGLARVLAARRPVGRRPMPGSRSDGLEAILGNGVRVIIVESASRFARDLITQETGFRYLRDRGITLIASDDPDAFIADTPTANLIRQVLGAVSEFQKAELVAKLAGARARKRANDKNYREGRKPAPAAAVALARRLRRKGLSLRDISGKLAEHGFLSPSDRPYLAQSVKAMLAD
jgi:hypothetical protein